jgi:hypothetical protein
MMTVHISNRNKIVQALNEELLGPSPAGQEIDCSNLPLKFESFGLSFGPFKEKSSGEEIIIRDYPTKRYGIGVLYPFGSKDEEIKLDKAGQDSIGNLVHQDENQAPVIGQENEITSEQRSKVVEAISETLSNFQSDDNPDDYDLSLANTYQPSSIGITFLANLEDESKLELSFTGGRYSKVPVQIENFETTWWVRKPIKVTTVIVGKELLERKRVIIKSNDSNTPSTINTEGLNIGFEVLSRQLESPKNQRLITVSFVNRTSSASQSNDEKCVFQSNFFAKVISPNSSHNVLPYPGPPITQLNEEDQSLTLLYRKFPTYCVGHGCAGDWQKEENEKNANTVFAKPLPTFETASITPDIYEIDGTPIKVPMAPLAGLVEGNDGFGALEKLISQYETWIKQKQDELSLLPTNLIPIAEKHLEYCRSCSARMRNGLSYLKNDDLVAKAFRLANCAILLQQIRPKEKRPAIYNRKTLRIEFNATPEVNPLYLGENQGAWRAFQIAFMLMVIKSVAKGNIPDRDIVELIWFPTGGGKTEAYLGLVAFSIFLRRLKNPDDQGVNVLMRYTLRLLTTQQFQRASKLILAMESLRRKNPSELGKKPISIGMWVGGANTPNKRAEALTSFRELERRPKTADYKFVLDRCPWCGAEIGPIFYGKQPHKFAPKTLGLEQEETTIVFKCPDPKCEFSEDMPIYLIDEDVYEFRPSMVIGTVDKFAMLAWQPKARAIFGIDPEGIRICSPPGLIIQDELHLISGPLGSMVGLYETIIEELCTDRRNDIPIKPKIVSSTATIRRYEEQILCLYGREHAALFPPPGLDAGDSFFSKYATDNEGKLKAGRLYVGVHAPGLGSMQTAQVRTLTSLLQAPMFLPEKERDPWWTLLLFFNSLRELGTTLSLLQSDIPDFQQVLVNRLPAKKKNWRRFWGIKELTGRAKNEDIPKALASLEVPYPGNKPYPIDVCLASNILEVGVDIDRLSLMSVIGQPKTTSQYIQVTGRVGRSWWARPGLVVTIYSASKPRDRSHFEKFRTYHERLYSQVEPTSVTPFSPPALDRALHAVIVSYARQLGSKEIAASPYPFPEDILNEIKSILLPRIQLIDSGERDNFEKAFTRIVKQWKTWERVKWSGNWGDDDDPLLRRAGSYTPQEKRDTTWETPMSMRSVDAECIVEIADSVIQAGASNAE